MSATNRGYKRHKSDYYVTPKWIIRDFFFINEYLTDMLPELTILDPAAGGCSENPTMPYPEVLVEYGALEDQIYTMDIRKDSPAMYPGQDFLTSLITPRPDMIITNPPFHLAQKFIEKSLEISPIVVMLLRLNFLGSKKRFEWWQGRMPTGIFVHHRRPSFTTDGKTDATEYGHFVWFRQSAKRSTYTHFLKVI